MTRHARPGPFGHTGLFVLLPVLLVLSCDYATDPTRLSDYEPVEEWTFDRVATPDLEGVWGGGGSVVTVGGAGQIMVYDGAAWASLAAGDFAGGLSDVWGSPADGLFASARENVLLHYDGTGWSRVEAPVDGDTQLHAIWGASPAAVFAVGSGGDAFLFDGSEWTLMETPTVQNLWAVWGFGADDVYAVGTANVILHWDGAEWRPMDAPEGDKGLRAVWGAAPDDLWAAGVDTELLHYDGSAWTAVDPGQEAHFSDLWGSSATDVWAVGSETSGIDRAGRIFHYDGTGWTVTTVSQALAGVWGSGPDDVWAVGDEGLVLHYDGTEWSTVRGAGGHGELYGLHAIEGTVFAAGAGGVLRSGALPGDWAVAVSDEESVHYDAWGAAEDELHVVGGGINYLMRVRAGSWESHTPAGGWGTYRGVWGASSSDVFAVGTRILHFDGGGWSVMLGADGGYHFTGVWGTASDNVYAVQDRGDASILHYDGTQWRSLDQHLPADSRSAYLTGIWGAAHDDIFAVGGRGVVLHWDGSEWTRMETGTTALLYAVDGGSPADVYAVGEECTVLHYDGLRWQRISHQLDCRVSLHDVLVRPGQDILMVGEAGAIIRGMR